jgi:SnoaL-like domain
MVKWMKVLTTTALGLGVVGWVVVRAQPRKPPALSVEDYFEIQQLVAHYPYPLDTAKDQGKAYAANFDTDGIFHDQHDHYYRGAADLATVANLDKREYTPDNVQHFISSHVIEPTENGGAIGHEELILVSDFGEEKDGRRAVSIVSYQYEDIYVKTPAGWRFKVRSHPRPGADPPDKEGELWHIRPLSRP